LKVNEFGIHYRKVVLHGEQTLGGIGHALATGSARYPAQCQDLIALQLRFALHQQAMAGWQDLKQILGANVDAVPACGAGIEVHYRQSRWSHLDRIKHADHFAVRQAQATIAASLGATAYRGGRSAGLVPVVFGQLDRDVSATGAVEPGNPLLATTHVNAEEVSDQLHSLAVRGCALTGLDLPGDDFFGESAASWKAAGTAIVSRQDIRHRVYSRVLEYFQALIGHRQHDRQNAGKGCQKPDCL